MTQFSQKLVHCELVQLWIAPELAKKELQNNNIQQPPSAMQFPDSHSESTINDRNRKDKTKQVKIFGEGNLK